MTDDAISTFSYGTNGQAFRILGKPFKARQGRWVGAKVGIFALGPNNRSEMGYADFDWFVVE